MNKQEISAVLKSQFGLTADVQVIHVSGEQRLLYQLEHIPLHRRMTMAGLERLCRRIAKALDAELYGTVNIDFASLGKPPTFDLLLEVLEESFQQKGRRHYVRNWNLNYSHRRGAGVRRGV